MVKSTNGMMSTSAMLIVAGAMLAFVAPPAGAQSPGNLVCNGCVGSKDIQNGGVKRKDIKKNAVNGTKVRDNSLTGADLLDNSLTGADLQNGSVTGADLRDGSVGTADLSDGAVTFAKLAADAVFLRTVVVSPVGPAATDNCDELRAALDGITDNAAGNPYLVYLEPGLYDCGSTALAMKPFVGIRGAGQKLTEITGSVISGGSTGLVVAASGSTLGHLSVTNSFTGTGDSHALVSVGTDIAVYHATLTGSASSSDSNGMRINGGSPTLAHVTAVAGDAGSTSTGIVAFSGASVAMDSVTARSAKTGSNSTGLSIALNATVTARNSVFSGDARGIFAISATANLVSTQIVGGTSGGGTFNCVGSYDGAFAVLPPTC